MPLTPSSYFRVASSINVLEKESPETIPIPDEISRRLKVGDGVLLADYDPVETTGLVRYLGIVQAIGARLQIQWKGVNCQIWVDTGPGRFNWASKAGFGFAPGKITDYGLHHLFSEHFDQLEVREEGQREKPTRKVSGPAIAKERLVPMELVGEPTSAARGGYVYALKSAYGYKIGRTRNIPSRMRAFGVHLPFIYTIEFCAWFDDHIEAESRYHKLFATKQINGEWFDLSDQELSLVHQRVFE